MPPFSKRQGYFGQATEITIREDAPKDLRFVLLEITYELAHKCMGERWEKSIRDAVAKTLQKWLDPRVHYHRQAWEQVEHAVYDCEWYRVYDVIEAVDGFFRRVSPKIAQEFTEQLNDCFVNKGIGWQLVDGQIVFRGPEAFEIAVNTAPAVLQEDGRATAARQIHEALQALSRRPEPNFRGAIIHGMGALECIARDLAGDQKLTLGEALKRHPNLLPKLVEEALSKLWGYASNEARHVEEPRAQQGRSRIDRRAGSYRLHLSHQKKPGREMTLLALQKSVRPSLPQIIANAGDRAALRFVEYFTVNIRNKNTRAAYGRAAAEFFQWCEGQGIDALGRVQQVHVAAYIELLQGRRSAPTVKQHLACIRMLFDWLVTGQVMPSNPAHSVRGPRHSVSKGSTPVLSSEEATALLTGMDVSTVVGLRDRAIIAVMTYTFARVGAVVALTVEDYFSQKKRWWLRLHEKNGKVNEMPCHHKLEDYLDAYLKAPGTADDRKGPLFRSAIGKTRKLGQGAMSRTDVWYMVRRRAADAGIETAIGCHTFRATGITDYLTNGGRIEVAQRMAGHSNAKTTGLYDRRNDEISVGEVERIGI